MAVGLLVSVYGVNGQGFGSTQGNPMVFPAGNIMVRPLVPAEVYQGVSCNSAIQLLPTGLKVSQPVYYTAWTVAQINTGTQGNTGIPS